MTSHWKSLFYLWWYNFLLVLILWPVPKKVYLFIWKYKRYFLPYLCITAPPIEIKMFPYMLSWHCWFLCFHFYIRYGFGVASRRKQSELAKTRKDFMNRGQSISGPRVPLRISLSISFHCLSPIHLLCSSLLCCFITEQTLTSHSSHAYSLQLWPSAQTGGLSLGPGFVFSEMRLSFSPIGPNVCHTNHSVGRVLAWPCHSDVVLGLP